MGEKAALPLRPDGAKPEVPPAPPGGAAASARGTASPLPPSPGARPEATSPRAAPAPLPGRDSASRITPLLTVAGFVILAGCIAYLWTRPAPEAPMPALPPNESGVIAALRTEITGLQDRLSALDHRERADILALHQEIAGLGTAASGPGQSVGQNGGQPATAAAGAAAPDLSAEIAALGARLRQVETASASASANAPSAAALGTLSSKLDGLAARQSSDIKGVEADLATLRQQIADLGTQTKTLAAEAGAVPRLSAEAQRLGSLSRAAARLAAGQPLGTLADAPPALARYAHRAPPTEAALRLSYPAAARAAAAASRPETGRLGFWRGMWLRVENLVTLRQGDRVIVGDPVSGVLAHAQRLLDAGDLAGAVSLLGGLPAPAAAAMAPWLDEARGLIAARQALAEMAAH
ncbi:hypothetical protein AcidC75_31060 [Acidisoma sp. C75]